MRNKLEAVKCFCYFKFSQNFLVTEAKRESAWDL